MKKTLVVLLAVGVLTYGLFVAVNADPVPIKFGLEKIADGVYAAITEEPKPPAVSNAAFIVLSDGVLVVDSHMTVEAAKSLLEEIKNVTEKPVRYLVQTHFHGDHVGGNPAFPDAIDIVAHINTRRRLESSNPTGAVLPNALIEDGITFIRGREVQVKYSGRGHTDGDLCVWLPKEKALITGDLLFNGYIGFMKDGFARDWVETLGKLRALKPEKVVPGHGPVTNLDGLMRFQTFISDFIREVRVYKDDKGLSKSETVKQFRLPQKYQHLGMQEFALRDNVARVYDELNFYDQMND